MESCLYEGRVYHCRTEPTRHSFGFPLELFYLDLDELDEVFRGRWLWSVHRPALGRFRREDHLGDPNRELREAVRDEVERQTGRRPDGPVRLLTQLRCAGYVFNPISLYYCFDVTGRALQAVVAEVTSTPWKERIAYVIEAQSGGSTGDPIRSSQPKRMHVSPFMGMDFDHAFELDTPGEGLRVSIENRAHDGGRPFFATLELRRRPLNSLVLARHLLRYPVLSLQVTWAIYWQAWRLWRKGTPFHPHPRDGGARLEVAG